MYIHINYHYFTDPCDTIKYLNDWKRSVAFTTETMMICDNLLIEDWYRVTSGSGERMPTECPTGGFRCNTGRPIWLSSGNIYFLNCSLCYSFSSHRHYKYFSIKVSVMYWYFFLYLWLKFIQYTHDLDIKIPEG